MTAPSEQEAAAELARLRDAVGEVDARIVALIAERVRLAGAIGAAKRQLGRPTLDPRREAAVVRRAGELAREHGLDDEAVRAVFWQLMALARREQEK
jgi:chorismate mutase